MAPEVDFGMRYQLLYQFARDLNSSLELDVVLRKAMDGVIMLMKAARGFIVLVDPVTGELSVQMSSGEADPEKARQFLGSRTVIDQVIATKDGVVTTDASLDDRFKGKQSVILQNLRSIIAVPLRTKGKVIGAVYVDNPYRVAIFEETKTDKEFLQAISDLAAVAIDNARQYERSEFLRELFELHVNKQVTDYVLAHSDRDTMMLAGERRNVTILNSDIAGFSRLSQSMGADELVEFLNDYFRRMIEVVLAHGGNIDKFQGDGMLVVFGAPNPMEDHAEQALRAAQGMVKEIDCLNHELISSGRAAISVGIGLDTGEVVAGHVGSKRRLEFTLIGVPVNNAAYLSKVRPAKVLLSEATLEALPPGVGVAGLEAMLLKGAPRPQSIYELDIVVIAET
ncbi:MAG TPA: adenylate/guanylate cyclase domain-containing protein [Candidatus Dormibacteraeota bacterium]|nr:adenylate/guanylate cyclase domain-containing protein [Candidatus Dormibacteraeota bacterium]